MILNSEAYLKRTIYFVEDCLKSSDEVKIIVNSLQVLKLIAEMNNSEVLVNYNKFLWKALDVITCSKLI